jgi:hypothetical protein
VNVEDLMLHLAKLHADGRAKDRVLVRGYEGGLDDVSAVQDLDVYPDRLQETYYGRHVPADQADYWRIPADAPRERAVRLVGSRDDDDYADRLTPEETPNA